MTIANNSLFVNIKPWRLEPTFRTLYCHNRFLRDFGNLISHFLYTEVGNRTCALRFALLASLSQVRFRQIPKIRSVTLQGAEWGLEKDAIASRYALSVTLSRSQAKRESYAEGFTRLYQQSLPPEL